MNNNKMQISQKRGFNRMKIAQIKKEETNVLNDFNSTKKRSCFYLDENFNLSQGIIIENDIETKNIIIYSTLITVIDITRVESSMEYAFYFAKNKKIEKTSRQKFLIFPVIKSVDSTNYLISNKISNNDNIILSYIVHAMVEKVREGIIYDNNICKWYFDTAEGWKREFFFSEEDESDREATALFNLQYEEGAWDPYDDDDLY